MDVVEQAQVLLRDAGFTTRPLRTSEHEAIAFEDDAVLGFLHLFPDAPSLVSGWSTAQKAALARCAPQLRLSREKAWNVYAVFLTAGAASPAETHEIDRIEEDFKATRKIARSGVKSVPDLQRALLPLLPLRATPELSVSDYQSKLRSRLAMLPTAAADAILSSVDPEEIARILMERQ